MRCGSSKDSVCACGTTWNTETGFVKISLVVHLLLLSVLAAVGVPLRMSTSAHLAARYGALATATFAGGCL
jgi:hypothetical protein